MTPGDLLVILLKRHDMTQAQLAALIGRPAQMLSEITHGKKRVTAETAIQFESVFGLPARIWLSLQDEADLLKAQARLPETMFRTTTFDDSTDEKLIQVTFRAIDEAAEQEWYDEP